MSSHRARIRMHVTCLALILLAATAVAQDAHYWTVQHGNQARLLGGAVVGGAEDVSATYYNPARLALLESPELLLAGNVFERTTLSVDGAVGNEEYKSTRMGSVPSLFAGQIRAWSQGESQWAYSFLNRHNSQFRVEERQDIADLLSYPTDQAVSAYSFDQDLSEYWGGLTWARPLGDHLAVGVTGYVVVRNHRSRTLVTAQAAQDPIAGLALQRRDFDYNHYSVLAKVGLAADLGAWRLGLAATTPNLEVFGSGAVGLDESYVGQDLDGDGDLGSQVLSGYEDGVDAAYRSSPSVAAGVSYVWDPTVIHLTAEWFAGVAGYRVLDASPVTSSDGLVTREPDLNDSRQAVLNAGIGIEHRFAKRLRGYASFRTDFSAVPEQQDSQIAVGVWDIYHVGAGATFDALQTTFTLGMIYAFGNADAEQVIGLVPDDAGEGTIDDASGDTIEFSFRRLTGLLGFTFGF